MDFVQLDIPFEAQITLRRIGKDSLNLCIIQLDDNGDEESKSCVYIKDANEFFNVINKLKL